MTQTDWSAFFRKIDALPKGDRVSLKREAGTMLSQANGRAIRVFYQCLPYSVPQWQEERAFAAACLHCLWDADEARRQPMEQVFYQLGRNQNVSESVGHRVEVLLDLPWDEDGFLLTKLSRMVQLAKSKGYAVDCRKLLEDLLYWNGEKQTIQRKWARALYIKPEETQSESKGEGSTHAV